MASLKEIVASPAEREGKRVRLKLKVLGRRKCPGKNYGFMLTRSDVTLLEEDICVFGEPLPFNYRDKTIEAERTVEVKEGKIRLSRPKIIHEEPRRDFEQSKGSGHKSAKEGSKGYRGPEERGAHKNI